MVLAREMTVNAIARLVNEHDTRLWRVLHHYVEKARSEQDYSDVEKVGIDETSSKRGHNYITTFVDMAQSKVLFATPGKDAGTLTAFRAIFTSVYDLRFKISCNSSGLPKVIS